MNKIKLNENSDMNNTFIWDSLTHIKIIVEIEKILKKKLSIQQVINLNSVKKIDKLFYKWKNFKTFLKGTYVDFIIIDENFVKIQIGLIG